MSQTKSLNVGDQIINKRTGTEGVIVDFFYDFLNQERALVSCRGTRKIYPSSHLEKTFN